MISCILRSQYFSVGMQNVVVGMIVFTLLTACSNTGPYQFSAGDHYVNLGSSFAAGPGVSEAVVNSPKRCGQSTENYANQIARNLKLDLVDRSCSGATSEHLLNPWEELPAQIDAVNEQTRLVTILIGGNDLGYIGGLMTIACEHHDRNSDDPNRNTCLPGFPLPTEEDYISTESRLNQIALTVRKKAPKAVLVFVDHAKVLPAGGVCDLAPISIDSARQSTAIANRLAEITAKVAGENNAHLIQTSRFSREHHVCAEHPWVNGYPDAVWTFEKLPFHPKREAMDAITRELLKILQPDS